VSPGNLGAEGSCAWKGPLKTCKNVFGFQAAVRAENSSVVILDFHRPFLSSIRPDLGALVGAYVATQKVQRKLVVAGMGSQVKTLMNDQGFRSSSKPTTQVSEAEEGALPSRN